MKLNLFLFYLLITSSVFSQEFTGKWKAIIYEDEISYYDKRNDSISFINGENPKNGETFKLMVNQLFLSNTYEFDSQNNLTISGIVMGKIISKFEIDRKNKRIKVAEAKKDPDFWNYEFENNILKVEMPTEKGFIKLSFVKK